MADFSTWPLYLTILGTVLPIRAGLNAHEMQASVPKDETVPDYQGRSSIESCALPFLGAMAQC
jgi:hypothetical protein